MPTGGNMSQDKKHIRSYACPVCSKSGQGTSASEYETQEGKKVWICWEAGCPTGNKFKELVEDSAEPFHILESRMPRRTFNPLVTREDVTQYPSDSLHHKGITQETVDRFGIKVTYNETTGEIDTVYYPYYIKKSLSGYKVKKLPKEFLNSIGSTKGVDPFGWHLLKPARKIIITEGEDDACIIYQVLTAHFKNKNYGSECQVISLPNGAQVRDLIETKAKQLAKMFDEVILAFDMDKAGQKAVQDFTMLWDPTKLKVMEFPAKDANEAFLEFGEQSIIDSFWNAKAPELGGMVFLEDMIDLAYEGDTDGLSYPWDVMTSQTGGSKEPELFVLMGGSGGGKTDLATEMARHFAQFHGLDVNYYSLEMSLKKSARRMISKQVGRKKIQDTAPEQIVLDKQSLSPIQKKLAFYDISKGMLTTSHLINLMRQQTVLRGVKIHFIDNLTQLTNGSKQEKTEIDDFIAQLKDLMERYDLRVFLLVHLNRDKGSMVDFEEGASISPRNLYGSGAPHKWCDTLMAVERNQYHSDPEIRNTTICRWLKTRDEDNAATGKIFALKYDSETGLYKQTKPIDIIEKAKDEEDSGF